MLRGWPSGSGVRTAPFGCDGYLDRRQGSAGSNSSAVANRRTSARSERALTFSARSLSSSWARAVNVENSLIRVGSELARFRSIACRVRRWRNRRFIATGTSGSKLVRTTARAGAIDGRLVAAPSEASLLAATAHSPPLSGCLRPARCAQGLLRAGARPLCCRHPAESTTRPRRTWTMPTAMTVPATGPTRVGRP